MSTKERMIALAKAMSERWFPKLSPFVEPVLVSSLSRAKEEDLRRALIEFRDQIIPWLLEDGEREGPDRAE